MSLTEFDKVLSRLPHIPHSRAALALVHAISDSQTREHVVPFGSTRREGLVEDYFEKLLADSDVKTAWESYTNVMNSDKFPQKLAKGTASLNGFRHYTLQDAIYLEYYIRVRLEAIAAPESKASTTELIQFADEIKSGLQYSAGVRDTCEKQLGIQKSALDDEWNNHRSTELQTSVQFYEKIIKGQADSEYKGPIKPWIDIHFALLPCIRGYYTVATNTNLKPLENTLYYSLWIWANKDDQYVKAYNDFIHNNTGSAGEEDWKHWRKLFLQACKNEEAFFNLAISNYGQYEIVREGNVVPILSHASATEYLSPDGNDGVTLKSQEQKWELTNSKDGYTIKIKVDGTKYKFLKADVGTHKVSTVDDESQATKWYINFTTEDQTYQLFVAGYMQFGLTADNATKTVTVEENTTTTSGSEVHIQARTTWVFKKV